MAMNMEDKNTQVETEKDGSSSVRAVDRALDVLLCFTADTPALNMTQISERIESIRVLFIDCSRPWKDAILFAAILIRVFTGWGTVCFKWLI